MTRFEKPNRQISDFYQKYWILVGRYTDSGARAKMAIRSRHTNSDYSALKISGFCNFLHLGTPSVPTVITRIRKLPPAVLRADSRFPTRPRISPSVFPAMRVAFSSSTSCAGHPTQHGSGPCQNATHDQSRHLNLKLVFLLVL